MLFDWIYKADKVKNNVLLKCRNQFSGYQYLESARKSRLSWCFPMLSYRVTKIRLEIKVKLDGEAKLYEGWHIVNGSRAMGDTVSSRCSPKP